MSLPSKNLDQTATYWSPATPDGYGGSTFSTPIQIKCRWEDQDEEFVNTLGVREVSRSRVFVGQDVVTGGYLLLGVSTETNPVHTTGAWKIKVVRKMRALKRNVFQREVLL